MHELKFEFQTSINNFKGEFLNTMLLDNIYIFNTVTLPS